MRRELSTRLDQYRILRKLDNRTIKSKRMNASIQRSRHRAGILAERAGSSRFLAGWGAFLP